jgi:hypothetical protein
VTNRRGRTGIGSAPRGLVGAAFCGLALIGAVAACARPGNTPAGTPSAPVTTTVTLHASAIPAAPLPVSAFVTPVPHGSGLPMPVPPGTGLRRPGVADCAQPAVAVPKPATTPRPDAARPGAARPNPAQPGAAQPGAAQPGAAQPGPVGTHPRGSGANDAGSAQERAQRALDAQLRAAFPTRGPVPEAVAKRAAECARLLQIDLTLRTADGRPVDDKAVRAALAATGLTKAVVEPGPRFATSTGEACIIGTVTKGKPAMVIAPLPKGGTCRP